MNKGPDLSYLTSYVGLRSILFLIYCISFVSKITDAWLAVLTGKIYKGSRRLGFQNVAFGRINGVRALTGFY